MSLQIDPYKKDFYQECATGLSTKELSLDPAAVPMGQNSPASPKQSSSREHAPTALGLITVKVTNRN